MPKISNKGREMPSSPIRKLAPFAEQAKKKGVRIYHLNIGQPDIETPAPFWTKLKQLDKKILEYSPSNGFEDIREAYAGFFRNRYHLDLNAADIMITAGASEALSFVLYSILDEGDEVIATEPLYANYIGFAQTGGIVMKPVTTYIDNGFALPSVEAFEKAITPKTKAILICNPSNPTGYCYSEAELVRLKEIVVKHDLFLISDEVYRDFVYNRSFKSMLEYAEIAQNVIVVDSISKRFSACGARIGMVTSKNKEVLATIMKFAQQRLSPPGLGQIAALALFDGDDTYFGKVNQEYLHRREILVEGLNQIPGVECPTPGGAFYCMVKLPVKDSDHFCQWMLEHFQHEGETVMMAPGAGFYATPGLGKDQVRVAYVLNGEDLKKAIFILQKGLEKYLLEF
ncbi:MAG: pyridoxal phosphate-dependent aminotransferase [Chitinophagales bacterium]|nr:pyridoxal phosphate-dependent aminotransferase [Chitinophagales bacterium]